MKFGLLTSFFKKILGVDKKEQTQTLTNENDKAEKAHLITKENIKEKKAEQNDN